MEKKYLDADGVSYLYQQLSLEDYPNNETLIAVINAIDEGKADKTEVEELRNSIFSAQVDYNQNDSTAINYIANRPFYEETVSAGIAGNSYIVNIADMVSTTGDLPNHAGDYFAYELPSTVPMTVGHEWGVCLTNYTAGWDQWIVYSSPNGNVSIYGQVDLPYVTVYDGKVFVNSF